MEVIQEVPIKKNLKVQMKSSPTQQKIFDEAKEQLERTRIVGVNIHANAGKTTVLRALCKDLNGQFLRLGDFFLQIEKTDAFRVEEAVYRTIYDAFKNTDVLIIDDFSTIEGTLSENYYSRRPIGLEDFTTDAIKDYIEANDKKLILGLNRNYLSHKFFSESLIVEMDKTTAEDYAYYFKEFGGKSFSKIDYKRIHQYSANLNINQIRKACKLIEVEKKETFEAEQLIEALEKHAIVSNVDRKEVEEIKLEDLKGLDEVIRQLEIDVITPLENPEMAAEYGMRPKRGVLLYGSPGTGKTSVGKALAHRLKSKFFLIDGTVISGTGGFYREVHRIMNYARNNAPSIVFIDDCDLLLENGRDDGFYRYLLTLLDGLESKGNQNITVIMTTMHLSSIPDALIRSGRVELWLEMKLPNESARTDILKTYIAEGKLHPSKKELTVLIKETDGFTGADLKRLVSDAVNIYGYDIVKKNKLKKPLYYFEHALERLKKLRKQFYKSDPNSSKTIGFGKGS